MRNYNAKVWRQRFQKYARRGGQGAHRELDTPSYNAFTALGENEQNVGFRFGKQHLNISGLQNA